MTEQVIIKMDSKLKRGVQRRAKAEGTTLSSVLRQAAMNYYSGQTRIGLVNLSQIPIGAEELNTKTERALVRAERDFKLGRNISPAFTDIESMRKYLKI